MPTRIEAGFTVTGYDNLTAYTGTNVTTLVALHGFGTVYATTFSGSATSSQTLDVGGTARSSSISLQQQILLRLEIVPGDIYANVFYGIATQAPICRLSRKIYS